MLFWESKYYIKSYKRCFLFSEMQDVILVLYSSTATTLASRLCGDLDSSSFFTIPTSELRHSRTDTETTNLNNLKNSIEITNKTLCLLTSNDTQAYISCVNEVLGLKNLHDKIFILCCKTEASQINMPKGCYYRCFSNDAAIFDNSIKLLSKASGTCFNHSVVL